MILVETYLLKKGENKRKQTNRRTDRQTPSLAPALVPTPSTGFEPDWVYVSLHETRPTTTLYLPNGFLAKFELARICLCISKNCKSVSSCGQYFPFLAKWIMNYKCLCILWQYFIYVFPCFCTYSKNTHNFLNSKWNQHERLSTAKQDICEDEQNIAAWAEGPRPLEQRWNV